MKNSRFLERVRETQKTFKKQGKFEGKMKWNNFYINVHIDSRPEDIYTIYNLKFSHRELNNQFNRTIGFTKRW